jgi:hypothetical protein
VHSIRASVDIRRAIFNISSLKRVIRSAATAEERLGFSKEYRMPNKEHLLDKRVVRRALQEGLLDKAAYQRVLDELPDLSHKVQAPDVAEEAVRPSPVHENAPGAV